MDQMSEWHTAFYWVQAEFPYRLTEESSDRLLFSSVQLRRKLEITVRGEKLHARFLVSSYLGNDLELHHLSDYGMDFFPHFVNNVRYCRRVLLGESFADCAINALGPLLNSFGFYAIISSEPIIIFPDLAVSNGIAGIRLIKDTRIAERHTYIADMRLGISPTVFSDGVLDYPGPGVSQPSAWYGANSADCPPGVIDFVELVGVMSPKRGRLLAKLSGELDDAAFFRALMADLPEFAGGILRGDFSAFKLVGQQPLGA